MLGVHETCNREYQRKKGIQNPEKLRIYMYGYIVHDTYIFMGICQELKSLEGILL